MKRLYKTLFVVLIVTITTTTGSSDIIRAFNETNPEVEEFNHLVVDKNTGRVYIGAVNRLYQLSPDLDLVIEAKTGPDYDAEDCSVLECNSAKKKLTNNVNKALVIDYTTTRLISCGSLFQGICLVRNLHNISDAAKVVREAVVANDATASTVAFIAPGPPNPPVTQVMYVGVTFSGKSLYRTEVPAVSSRSLDKDKMFSIAQTAVTTGTRMFVNSLARERYVIKYVYGFASEGFSYFLTTQMKHTTSQNQYISKLVRVCHDDENYYSYTEIPMDCTHVAHGDGTNSNGNKNYNLVQAAYVGKAGSELASVLGITAQDDVLFAVFSASDPQHPNQPTNHSALCVYSLKAIRRKFMQNIKQCFGGTGERGLDFISPSHRCVSTVSIIIIKSYVEFT